MRRKPGPPFSVPEAKQDAIVKAYLEGKPLLQLAATFGMGYETCRKVLIRHNVPRRTRSESRREYSVDEAYFDAIDSEEKAYWLGFLAADGAVLNKDSFALTLSQKDEGHLFRFRSCLKSEHRLYRCETCAVPGGRLHPMISVQIHSRRLVRALESQGIGPRKSFTVKPWDGPADLLSAYWRGVVDGDGSVRRCEDRGGKGVWQIGLVGNWFITSGFATFVTAITGRVRTPKPKGRIYSLFYTGTWLPQQIARALYAGASIYLPRKQAVAEAMLAATVTRRSMEFLTAEELLRLYGVHGTWEGVRHSLDLDCATLNRIRKRRGLPVGLTLPA